METNKRKPHRFAELSAAAVTLFLFAGTFAQDLPKTIRGYKVHRADVAIQASPHTATSGPASLVTIGDPKLTEISLAGITFEVPARISGVPESGRVDFLDFHDFRVNGLKVDVEEYRTPFSLKKNEEIVLPKPATLFIGSGQVLNAAWKEFSGSDEDWLVTGRVFVFGRFRKFGFEFKRVVPIDISLKIGNPLTASRDSSAPAVPSSK